MALTVGIQRGLSEIENALNEKGYQVVSMEETEEPVDAIIYSGVNPDITGFQQLESYGDGASMGVNSPSGVVLVNAQGFASSEVIKALESRLSWED